MTVEQSNTHTERVSSHKKHLALDLSLEADNIRLHGDHYLPIFLDNMRSFTRETDTSGEIFSFQHVVRRLSDGSVRLYFDDRTGVVGDSRRTLIDARTSYLKPALDPDRPQWDRDRHMKEYEAIVALEHMLERAQPGDTFMESSPAPFDQPSQALEGTYYGPFSFVRMHSLEKDLRGQEVLRGSALKHYLNWSAQTELHRNLTGNDAVTPETLLGTVDRLTYQGTEERITIGDVASHIRALDAEVFVPYDNGEPHVDDAAIDDFLEATTPLLEDIFSKLKRNNAADRTSISKLVTYWRQAVRDFCNGVDRREEILEAYAQSLDEEDGLYDILEDMYGGLIFHERMNSCGFGAGFGVLSTDSGIGMNTIPTYSNLASASARSESRSLTGPDQRAVPCPTCKTKVVFSRRKVMKSKLLSCPCGECATGCDALAIAMNSKPAQTGPTYQELDRMAA